MAAIPTCTRALALAAFVAAAAVAVASGATAPEAAAGTVPAASNAASRTKAPQAEAGSPAAPATSDAASGSAAQEAAAGAPAAQAASDAASGTGGPEVTVPHCRIQGEGCGLDPATPQLDAAACAAAIATHLERRGVAARLAGPVQDVCAADPRALVMDASITASCPPADPGDLPRKRALRTRLRAELVLRDCAAGGETVGRGVSERAIEAGRRTLLRDAVEELGHGVSEGRIRRTHPGTPGAWLRADVGGEHTIEARAGFVDVKEAEINRFFRRSGLDEEKRASRATIETAYHPWSAPRMRFAVGLDAIEIKSEGDGIFDPAVFNADPNRHPTAAAHIEATFRPVGILFSAAYGLDLTRHQRVSGGVSLGFYLLGLGLSQADILVEGLQPSAYRLEEYSWGRAAEVRWEWRFTPHFSVAAAYGWNELNFDNPNRRGGRRPNFPFALEFSGPTAQGGIAVRF